MPRHEIERFPELRECDYCDNEGSVWESRPCDMEGCRFPEHQVYVCTKCASDEPVDDSLKQAYKTGYEAGHWSVRPEEYNGWSNRETWAANLHMTNDSGWAAELHEQVNVCHMAGDNKYKTGEVIKQVFELVVDGDTPFETVEMVLRDVGSVWRVDWVEIASSHLSGFDE